MRINFLYFLSFLSLIIYEVFYTWCLRHNICSAWFLDIRISTYCKLSHILGYNLTARISTWQLCTRYCWKAWWQWHWSIKRQLYVTGILNFYLCNAMYPSIVHMWCYFICYSYITSMSSISLLLHETGGEGLAWVLIAMISYKCLWCNCFMSHVHYLRSQTDHKVLISGIKNLFLICNHWWLYFLDVNSTSNVFRVITTYIFNVSQGHNYV